MPPRRWHDPSPQRPSASSLTDQGGLSEPEEDEPDIDNRRSSSPCEGRPNLRKRPAQDMTQYAERTGRQLRLKLDSTEALKEYSTLSATEQSIWLAGRILLQGEMISTLQVPDAVYHMPTTMEGAIDENHFLLLLDPQCSAYVKKGNGGPVDRLTASLNVVLIHTIIHNKFRSPISSSSPPQERMRQKLTRTRNALKDVIADSLGDPEAMDRDNDPTRLDIIALCQRAIALGSKLTTELKVSVEMCGRFAFLRETYVDLAASGKKGFDFWGSVDKALMDLRESKGHDKTRISKTIGDILVDDKALYGPADVEGLIQDSPIVFPS
ncbi:hypothetical protein B0H13DRAFT_2306135 [Mycena leptocephala]|nr:hypothetical protein B0H13DRAFT_2306135 [Mycena leptocephala]